MLGMIPAVSFVFVDTQEGIRKIRIIMAELSTLEWLAENSEAYFVNYNSKNGIQIKFTQSQRTNHLENIKQTSNIFYSELVFNDDNVFQ